VKIFKARIYITLKPGVFDPQGKVILSSLETLGHKGVQRVSTGKYFEIELVAEDAEVAKREMEDICQGLLANPVIEKWNHRISEAPK